MTSALTHLLQTAPGCLFPSLPGNSSRHLCFQSRKKKKNDIRSIKVQPPQSHLLSGTEGDVEDRIHCAFTKVRKEENDVPVADEWMDERMDGCRSGLPVCTCTRQSYLISQPHSSRSQGPGLLMATKNNQSGMRAPMCTTVTRAILKI